MDIDIIFIRKPDNSESWIVRVKENGEVLSVKSFAKYENAMQHRAMLLNGGPHEKEDDL